MDIPASGRQPVRTKRWSTLSIVLHWTTFLLVLALAIVGLLMVDMPGSLLKLKVYALHKSLGLTVLGLTAVRLAWRLLAPVPAPVAGTPAWQAGLARATHGTLYLLLLAMPLSGWWYNSAAGFPLRWFGLVSLPALVAFNRDAKALALATHELLFYALAGLIFIHASAALWHHYVHKDETLRRMLPS